MRIALLALCLIPAVAFAQSSEPSEASVKRVLQASVLQLLNEKLACQARVVDLQAKVDAAPKQESAPSAPGAPQ